MLNYDVGCFGAGIVNFCGRDFIEPLEGHMLGLTFESEVIRPTTVAFEQTTPPRKVLARFRKDANTGSHPLIYKVTEHLLQVQQRLQTLHL